VVEDPGQRRPLTLERRNARLVGKLLAESDRLTKLAEAYMAADLVKLAIATGQQAFEARDKALKIGQE
jgi:hypothetical protein